MSGPGMAPWLGVLLLFGGADAPQTIVKPATAPAPGTRHYLVQVRILEVDEQGRTTIVASPTVQTTGAAAGVTVDSDRGRRYEFHFSATEPGAPSPLPVLLADEAVTPKPIAVTSSTTVATDRVKSQRITLKAAQQSRKAVLREIARQAGVTLAVEPDAAAAVANWFAAPVSLDVENQPLEQVLGLLLGPAKLGYTLDVGILVIGTASPSTEIAVTPPAVTPPAATDPESRLVKVYDVSDLVSRDAATGRVDFAPLIQRLRQDVVPKSWDDEDHQATIRGFDSTVSLVIRQSPAGHAAVARYLADLRAKRP